MLFPLHGHSAGMTGVRVGTKDKYLIIAGDSGYVYDLAEHDGVAFEDLPEDWKCPRGLWRWFSNTAKTLCSYFHTKKTI